VIGMIDQQHPPAPLPRNCSAHQASAAGAEDDRVEVLRGSAMALA
jgi:hypothetical protein